MFAAEIAVNSTIPNGAIPRLLRLLAVSSFAILSVGTVAAYLGKAGGCWPLLDLLMAIFIVAILIAGYKADSILSKNLSFKPLAAVGIFTYSLYLIHFPIEEGIRKIAVHEFNLGPAGTFAMIMSCSPLILYAAWRFFKIAEEPFLQKRAKPAFRSSLTDRPPPSLSSPPP